MLSQLSIRAKIISLVSLLLLALAGMGLLAATSLRSLNANTREIAGNWLPSIKTLGELHADVITFRAIIRQHGDQRGQGGGRNGAGQSPPEEHEGSQGL
jgi:methyl-accepting chemotaxis protein